MIVGLAIAGRKARREFGYPGYKSRRLPISKGYSGLNMVVANPLMLWKRTLNQRHY